MNCPVCKKATLQNADITTNLKVKLCKQCGGCWIQSYQYWKWLDKHGDILPEKPVAETSPLPVNDSQAGKICPECGHFLTRRKVGRGISFHLDRCNNCGGIWFDKNEWEILHTRKVRLL